MIRLEALLSALFFCFHCEAYVCENIDISYIYDRKEIHEKIEFCTIEEKGLSYLVSKSCLKKNCGLLKADKEKISQLKLITQIGSPGFHLCRELGGLGQIFKLKKMQKTLETQRCLIGQDFVELSLLVDSYL